MKNSIEGIMNQVLNLDKESLNESTAVDEAKSKKDGLPDTKKGFTYQDDDGNIYHSDVEIASYIDPETGKETRVFSYGKGAGLGAKTKKPLAVVSGMSNESAKLKRLMRENRRLHRSLKRRVNESGKLSKSGKITEVGSDDDNSFYVYDITKLINNKNSMPKDVSNYIDIFDGKELKDNMENTIDAYDLDLSDPEDKRINDDIEKIIKNAKDDHIYGVVENQFGEPDIEKVESDIELNFYKEESAKLSSLMRENRRLRRGLRESNDVVKIGSDDDNSFYIYDVTPLVDRTVKPGEEVAGYIELYNGKDLKVLIKKSIKAYDLDLDDPVDKSINDDLEDVIKKAKSNNIYAVVTDQFREPDVNKIEKAIKRAI